MGDSRRAVHKQAGYLLYKNWILTVFIPMGLSLQQRQQRTLPILGIMESAEEIFPYLLPENLCCVVSGIPSCR